jgi:hypothetical protein
MLWHRVGIPVGAVAEVHVLIYDWGEQSVTVLESGSTVWANGKFQPGQTGVTSGVAGQGEIIFSVGSDKQEMYSMPKQRQFSWEVSFSILVTDSNIVIWPNIAVKGQILQTKNCLLKLITRV